MCNHRRSPWTESDSGQVSDSSVNCGNKVCLSFFSCSSIHELSLLHVEECAAMTRNVVKDWPTKTVLTVCLIGQSDRLSFLPLSDVIGQSDRLSFLPLSDVIGQSDRLSFLPLSDVIGQSDRLSFLPLSDVIGQSDRLSFLPLSDVIGQSDRLSFLPLSDVISQ